MSSVFAEIVNQIHVMKEVPVPGPPKRDEVLDGTAKFLMNPAVVTVISIGIVLFLLRWLVKHPLVLVAIAALVIIGVVSIAHH